jgi:nucleotide-binding universal stress UspA family protein
MSMYKKILIPVAIDHDHRHEDAITVAKALSAEGAEMILLTVLEDIPAYVTAEIPSDVLSNVRAETESELKAIAASAGGRARSEVVHGHAGVTIVEYAKDHGIDCIVIASHRPEWSDYLIGSTAARVVRHAPCAVHVMR